MASEEDRQHNRQLLKLSRARLHIREQQALAAGSTADPAIQIDIDQLRVDIAALEQLVNAPEPSPAVSEAIDRHLDGNVQFLFVQMLNIVQRLTRAEENDVTILQQQHAAQLDRLKTAAAIERLEQHAVEDDADRKRWQWLNRSLLIAILGIALAGILILLIWLDGRRLLAGVIGYLLLSALVGLALGRYLRWRAGG